MVPLTDGENTDGDTAAGIAAALQEAEEIRRRTHTRHPEDRGRGRPGNAPAPGA
ncbi:hypothetical protein ACIGW0_12420 [Streptomyces bikiniensis]|uniref:Uncharacterized protein n=1 Tax=Streptomyces bikiniensis TaxID=1896 RepID=A0ABW8CRI5_STRBI